MKIKKKSYFVHAQFVLEGVRTRVIFCKETRNMSHILEWPKSDKSYVPDTVVLLKERFIDRNLCSKDRFFPSDLTWDACH